MAVRGAGQRDGTEAGTAAMLYAGAIVGVVLRGVVWVVSAFTVGPLFGMLDLVLGAFHSYELGLFVQAVVTIAAVVSAVLCGLGLQTDPERYRLPTRLLSGLFILDVLIYLAPVVVVVTMDVGLTTTAWWLFAVATVGNLGLAGLAVLIVVRARRLRTFSAPDARISTTVEI